MFSARSDSSEILSTCDIRRMIEQTPREEGSVDRSALQSRSIDCISRWKCPRLSPSLFRSYTRPPGSCNKGLKEIEFRGGKVLGSREPLSSISAP